MPTYDYECENGHRFELFQSMNDEPIRECNQCGAKVKRLIGPGAGFLFKGDGFYITDYRSKDYKDKAKAETSSKSPASDSSSTAEKATGSKKSSESKGSGSKPGEAK